MNFEWERWPSLWSQDKDQLGNFKKDMKTLLREMVVTGKIRAEEKIQNLNRYSLKRWEGVKQYNYQIYGTGDGIALLDVQERDMRSLRKDNFGSHFIYYFDSRMKADRVQIQASPEVSSWFSPQTTNLQRYPGGLYGVNYSFDIRGGGWVPEDVGRYMRRLVELFSGKVGRN